MKDYYIWENLSVNEMLGESEEYAKCRRASTSLEIRETFRLPIFAFSETLETITTYTLGTKEANEREHEGSNKT